MTERFNNGGYTYDGFITDLTLAWQRAHEEAKQQIKAGEAPEVLAECVRYGLTLAQASGLL